MKRNALGINGDCFNNAIVNAIRAGGTVVHGLPVGTGPLNRGKRYVHAWAEANGLCFAQVGDRIIKLPKTIYYRKGQLTEEYVVRYTVQEALDLVAETGHVGPWNEELKDKEEVR